MGLFSKPKPPTPTDPTKVIAAQDQSNKTSAQQQLADNRVNQTNQYGSTSSYRQTGVDANGNPTFSQSTQWGQPTQDFNSGLMGLGGQYINRAQNMLDNPADLSSNSAFKQAQDYATATLGHQQEISHDRLDNQLKNQGLQPGTQAYDEAMRSQTAGFGDAMNNAMNPIQQQLFNQNLQGAQFGTNQLTQLANPGLQAGFQGMNAGFQNVPGINVGTTNAQGAYNTYDQQQNQAYQNQVNQYNGTMGALGTLGGLAMGGPLGGMMGKGLMGLGSYATGNGSMGAAG